MTCEDPESPGSGLRLSWVTDPSATGHLGPKPSFSTSVVTGVVAKAPKNVLRALQEAALGVPHTCHTRATRGGQQRGTTGKGGEPNGIRTGKRSARSPAGSVLGFPS